MRLLRYAFLIVLLATPAMVVATPSDATARLADAGSTAFATPGSVTPGGSVTFTVKCDQGLNAGGAAAVLDGSTLGLPTRIPMDSIDGSLFDFNITVTLPASIEPGGYAPHIDCPGGVEGAIANLEVSPVPRGAAATGDGTTATATNNWLAVTGLVIAGAGALAGGLAVRRRHGARPHS
jgi:hypothetical protein